MLHVRSSGLFYFTALGQQLSNLLHTSLVETLTLTLQVPLLKPL
jgi:hypothetical protein